MRSPLGVMQGRLLPKYKGRYQAHPVGNWEDEFPLAAEHDLDCIEFILDYDDVDGNPLMTRPGRRRITAAIRDHGVGVRSVCADYFMEAPLHDPDTAKAARSLAVLERLLGAVAEVGVMDVVIPCVDQSSLLPEGCRERLLLAMRTAIPWAERDGIHLCLETDLPPTAFCDLLQQLPEDVVTVNYDTGNSACLGYDFSEELAAYGDRISDVHIKDRLLGGGSVRLGDGDADIVGCLRELSARGFSGPIILQAYRDDEGTAVFADQLAWFRRLIGELS